MKQNKKDNLQKQLDNLFIEIGCQIGLPTDEQMEKIDKLENLINPPEPKIIKNKAFTLFELLVIIVILGILGTMAFSIAGCATVEEYYGDNPPIMGL